MPQVVVWQQWRSDKMSSEDCVEDLVRTRDPRAMHAIQAHEFLQKRQQILGLQSEILKVQAMLEARQRPFISHAQIEEWKTQYSSENYGVLARFQLLGLVGSSRQGKTSMALSLFGVQHTLKCGCQGCPRGVLPSLAAFDRSKHKAILFDECRVDQILGNKEFFQAGPSLQTMSQSSCNQYSYQVWVYQTALIVSTNSLPMTEEEGLSHADAEWLQANIVRVELAKGQTWFVR